MNIEKKIVLCVFFITES